MAGRSIGVCHSHRENIPERKVINLKSNIQKIGRKEVEKHNLQVKPENLLWQEAWSWTEVMGFGVWEC